ncbi:MAG: hypothetical protein GWN80_00020, partial [Gammaproteobacteria bacterium]|nr:hypothetical protein [Gammaproteobacteria bacterium]NIS52484.1 hypothetical protein [Phycisphaerae bacterium]
MKAKMKLMLLAVVMAILAVGQVQAATVTVPNGDFETIYKPGQTTITGDLSPAGGSWTQGVGPDCPIDSGEYSFSDLSTGTVADIPGWLGYDRDGWIALGGTYGRDQTTGNLQGSVANQSNHTPGGLNCYLANGDGWGNPAGGLIVSEASLGNIVSNATYTLSMYAQGSATPVVLNLLANGTILTPTSSVDPTLTSTFQEFSRTYDAADLTGYVGQALTIVCGVDRNAAGNQTRLDDVSLTYTVPSPPGQATNPNPADDATGISVSTDLSWTAGDGSDSSDIYFGTNPSPGGGEFQGNQVGTFFDPGVLDLGTTYYWRIDSVNNQGTTTGTVWSFTTIVDTGTCPPALVLPPVTGCDGLVLTDPSSIDTQSPGIITNVGGGIGGTDSTTVNNGEYIDILDSGCFQLGKDGNDFALSFWLKATGATQIIGTKTQYNGDQGFIVYVDGDSQLRVASSEGSGNTTITSRPFQLNEWVHVVVNYVNDGEDATFEINVNLAPTSGSAYANVYNSNLRIGDEGWGDISSFDVCIFQSWGRVLSRNEIKALFFDKAWDLGLSSANLSAVMSQLKDHMTGVVPLTGAEIEGLTAIFVDNDVFLDENMTVMAEAFDLVSYYEVNTGPLFINPQTAGGFARDQQGGDGFELDRAIFTVQQAIHDRIFDAENCQSCQPLFDGKKFETADFFPGACAAPADPQATYDVNINATVPEFWGKPVAFATDPARRPTGFYLAPGSIGEVTVPPSMVNQGFSILVGAHTWDKSVKSTIQRFDRVTKTFPVMSEVTSIANPFGGGIYIVVPYKANLGIVTVQIANAVPSPFFSATSFHQTTLQEWTDVERHYPGPWADFESDKFMMQVPTSWIYNYADPVTQMQGWDLAMDGFSELLGFPLVRNRTVLYVQPDISIAHGAYGIGYPQVNQTYNPDAPTNGNSNHFFLTDPIGWSTTYHELGHAQLFSKFPGHAEATVNLPYVYIATEKFGMPLVEAFTKSMVLAYLENMSVDQAALTWFVTENFRNGNPMDISNTELNEVRYQHRGYGRYVDMAGLFGWNVLSDFYYQEHLDYMAGTPGDGLDYTDSRILRLSKAAGVNLTPLIHCWGVHPVNPGELQVAIALEGLPLSQAIYDRLVHYKDIIPADNAEFWDHYLTIYPSQPEGGNPNYQYGWYNVWKYIYDETHGTAAKNAMQDIIDLYYTPDTDPPTPNPATFASPPAAVSDTEITMTATTGSDTTGPVEYFFDEISGNPGGTDSGWTTDPVYNDTGLTAGTQYTYTVQMRDYVTPVPNVGTASAPANATTNPPAGSGTGLKGDYYDNMDFTAFVLTRTDSTINFDWGTGSPDPSIGAETFSIRWTGQVEPFFSETYTFKTTSDDGVRLWVNSQLIIDNWTDHAPTDDTGNIALSASVKYDVTLEYYENGGGAVIKLYWSSASQTEQIIPQTQLYPATGDTDPPTPNPATFASPPAAVSDTEITMTATTGSDATGPVEYFFDEISGNPGGTDSGWTTNPVYNDTGLTGNTQYTYTVQMRDSVTPVPNVGTASTPANATTDPTPDTDPPTPDPATFASPPAAVSDTEITM